MVFAGGQYWSTRIPGSGYYPSCFKRVEWAAFAALTCKISLGENKRSIGCRTQDRGNEQQGNRKKARRWGEVRHSRKPEIVLHSIERSGAEPRKTGVGQVKLSRMVCCPPPRTAAKSSNELPKKFSLRFTSYSRGVLFGKGRNAGGQLSTKFHRRAIPHRWMCENEILVSEN